MTLRLVGTGDEEGEDLGLLSRRFLERMEEDRHSTFLTAPKLIIGDEEELFKVIRSLYGRGFGWLRSVESVEGGITPDCSLDRALYQQSIFVGTEAIHQIRVVPRWTDHVGVGVRRIDGVYRLDPGILAQMGPNFWLVRVGRETVHTPWMLIAPRDKP